MINPVESIVKKRNGTALSDQEMDSFFKGFLDKKVAPYQMGAMLMAIFWRGLEDTEKLRLTKIMRDSGKILAWPTNIHAKVCDKHSTGGVGDKTSLLILPLCVLEGLTIPMMSGRGLGFTGGTLDKLESIPGMRVRFNIEETQKICRELGGAFIGQSGELAPLDGELYAMRDVSGTVESIPLITASILSKKAAEGLSSLVLDVKFGSGSFMGAYTKARELALSLKTTGELLGLKVTAFLTSMNQVLGRAAGNWLEMEECLRIARGEIIVPDTEELSIVLARSMLTLSGSKESEDKLTKRLQEHLSSGRVYELLLKIFARQGADLAWLERQLQLPKTSPVVKPVFAESPGFVDTMDVRELGMVIVGLGGGRKQVTDTVNPLVGLTQVKKIGEAVSSHDEPLAIIHAESENDWNEAARRLRNAFKLSNHKPEPDNLVREVL